MKNSKIIPFLLNCLKGLVLGFVLTATPGVSGGTVAVMLGLFTKIIDDVDNIFHHWFKKDWWQSLFFLFVIAVCAVVGAYIGSLAVTFTYDKYPLAVTMLLIGLIFGSVPALSKNVDRESLKKPSNIFLVLFIFAATMVYTFAVKSGTSVTFTDMQIMDYILLGVMGIITTATMIIPGISGNIFLAAFGYWAPLNAILASITTTPIQENLPVLLTFAGGCVIGALVMVKLIKILLSKFAEKTNLAIITFVITSPIVMLKVCLLDNANFIFNKSELLIGSLLLVAGFAVSYFIGAFANNKEKKEND